ncbi:uncharacterized protein LOC122260771 [Penaeus japonicus]|uniref:uncharacterized protein LOC122260771 n=1 Tax=Penaeus japonicus TaxID=27405 RepID=UPI001C70CB74|nr:uncharacterized protein LOC122260771 [Penaeus japonicus]
MSQRQTERDFVIAQLEAQDGEAQVRTAAGGDSEASEKDKEAERCALNLVWANRYDVEIRRLRTEIKRQKYLLKLMNGEKKKTSMSTSSYVSLLEYEQQMQEGCAHDYSFETERARSAEPPRLKGDPARSRASSGSCIGDLHCSFPSMDSGVFLAFDAAERESKASTSSVLDQLEDLMNHPCEELTESVEDTLFQECFYPSSESLDECVKATSSCNSESDLRTPGESRTACKSATVSCSGSLPSTSESVISKDSLLDISHVESIQYERASTDSESEKLSLEKNCSYSVSPLSDRNQLDDICVHEDPVQSSSEEIQCEENNKTKSSDHNTDKIYVIESDFGWSLVEEPHPTECPEESDCVNSHVEETGPQRSYSEKDHLEISSVKESECDSSSTESSPCVRSTAETIRNETSPRVEEKESHSEGNQAKVSCADETRSASQRVKPCAEDPQRDTEREEELPEQTSEGLDAPTKLSTPDSEDFANLEHRTQIVRNGVDGITRLSLESMVDFVGLDDRVSSLLRTVRDTFRQSRIVFALESICAMLELRLEEEWWAAHDLHLAPSEINYVV